MLKLDDRDEISIEEIEDIDVKKATASTKIQSLITISGKPITSKVRTAIEQALRIAQDYW